MDRLWERMVEMYGSKLSSQYGDTPPESWLIVAQEIPVERFRIALNRIRAEHPEWPPTLGQFESVCRIRPEEIGAPGHDQAFAEACHGSYPYNRWPRWSHKCVYWAAVRTGQSDLAERPQKCRKEFDREYTKCLQEFATLDEPPVAVIAGKSEVIDRDESGEGFQAFLKAKADLFGGAE